MKSMNGNRLGNYSAAPALCGKRAGRKCENGRQQNGLKRNLKWALSVAEDEEEREEGPGNEEVGDEGEQGNSG